MIGMFGFVLSGCKEILDLFLAGQASVNVLSVERLPHHTSTSHPAIIKMSAIDEYPPNAPFFVRIILLRRIGEHEYNSVQDKYTYTFSTVTQGRTAGVFNVGLS